MKGYEVELPISPVEPRKKKVRWYLVIIFLNGGNLSQLQSALENYPHILGSRIDKNLENKDIEFLFIPDIAWKDVFVIIARQRVAHWPPIEIEIGSLGEENRKKMMEEFYKHQQYDQTEREIEEKFKQLTDWYAKTKSINQVILLRLKTLLANFEAIIKELENYDSTNRFVIEKRKKLEGFKGGLMPYIGGTPPRFVSGV